MSETRCFELKRNHLGKEQVFRIYSYEPGDNVFIFAIDDEQYLVGWDEAKALKKFLSEK